LIDRYIGLERAKARMRVGMDEKRWNDVSTPVG